MVQGLARYSASHAYLGHATVDLAHQAGLSLAQRAISAGRRAQQPTAAGAATLPPLAVNGAVQECSVLDHVPATALTSASLLGGSHC